MSLSTRNLPHVLNCWADRLSRRSDNFDWFYAAKPLPGSVAFRRRQRPAGNNATSRLFLRHRAASSSRGRLGVLSKLSRWSPGGTEMPTSAMVSNLCRGVIAEATAHDSQVTVEERRIRVQTADGWRWQ